MSAPIFLVEPALLDAPEAVLDEAESHHIRVRRVRRGSIVILSDGCGRQRHGVVVSLSSGQAVVRFTEIAVAPAALPCCSLTLAQAALKADKIDLVIQKGTELGVSTIQVLTSARSLGSVSEGRLQRWERIARSAAKQCGRPTVPTVTGPVSAAAVFGERTTPLRLLLVEPAACPPGHGLNDLRELPTPAAVMAIIGPEGGFTHDEVSRALDAGCRAITLGARTLRAETAAIVAMTLCQFLWGDLYPRCP